MITTVAVKNPGTSFPGGLDGKESICNGGDLGSIPGLGRSPGEGKGYPLQYSGLENATDCIVRGFTKSRTRLSNFHDDAKNIKGSPGDTQLQTSTLCSCPSKRDQGHFIFVFVLLLW